MPVPLKSHNTQTCAGMCTAFSMFNFVVLHAMLHVTLIRSPRFHLGKFLQDERILELEFSFCFSERERYYCYEQRVNTAPGRVIAANHNRATAVLPCTVHDRNPIGAHAKTAPTARRESPSHMSVAQGRPPAALLHTGRDATYL